jgi:hypothetical protein
MKECPSVEIARFRDINATPPESRIGAPNIETTPEVMRVALGWLYAFNPETSDGHDTVTEILKAVLANQSRLPA